jgi:hypothetical protein
MCSLEVSSSLQALRSAGFALSSAKLPFFRALEKVVGVSGQFCPSDVGVAEPEIPGRP